MHKAQQANNPKQTQGASCVLRTRPPSTVLVNSHLSVFKMCDTPPH